MVATAILCIILLLVFSITQQTGDAWKNSAAKIESFQGARAAFESMTRLISQATLNTCYDYFDIDGVRRTSANSATFTPAKYGRHSDLHFITGKAIAPDQITHSIFFQAPSGYSDDNDLKGLDHTLNGCGFFVQYNNDSSRPAFFETLTPAPPGRYRFRLMQFLQPTEKLTVYDYVPFAPNSNPLDWITLPLASGSPPVRQLAENTVALIVLPKRSMKDAARIPDAAGRQLAPEFEYNSRSMPPAKGAPGPLPPAWQPPTENQLPSLVELVMVAVDEPSFVQFGNSRTAPRLTDGLFATADNLDLDLQKLEEVLVAAPNNSAGNNIKLRYQIFRTEVPIRGAKWSE